MALARVSLAWLAVVALVVGLLMLVPGPAVAASKVQAVLHGYDCGDPLIVEALSARGTALGTRTLVNGKRDIAFRAHAVSPDNTRFVFSAYNCVSEAQALYLQSLTSRPVAQQVLPVPQDWWLLDATWDPVRAGPAVLIRDPNYNYFLQVLTGGVWTMVWSGSRASVGGYFLAGIEGQNGREYMLYGDDVSNWQIWRVTPDGRLNKELDGPGEISNVDPSPFADVNAIVGRNGSWVCDRFATGPIAQALTEGECATIPQGAAFGAVFTEATGNSSYWLNVAAAGGPGFMVRVTCVGAGIFSCGNPTVTDRRQSPLRYPSDSMAHAEFTSLKAMNRLRASTIR